MRIGKIEVTADEELKQEIHIIKKTAKITFALCVISFLIIIFTFYLCIVFWGPAKPAQAQLSSSLQGIAYVMQDFALDDKLSDAVVINCGRELKQYDKAWCVQKFMKSNYDWIDHDETLKSLSVMKETGGVCRDYANNFCRIMNRMEINCYLVPVDHHIFSIVEFSDYNLKNYNPKNVSTTHRCVVDQKEMFCW